ncbi:MAG TPA: PaaI family thioesterase [Thermoplasmata archaeon]|nr:PaaI family thioesterase [Thermoplasmata archaeon]
MASAKVPPAPKPVRLTRGWADRLGGFHREVGFRIDPSETREGHCVVSGLVEARHLNINGVVHGGVYATILDTAMGGAVVTMLDEDETTATTSLYVEFLRPAREGQTLRARGEVVRRGRHLAFVEGNLLDGDGTRLSQAHGTWYIWSASDPTWRQDRAAGGAPSTARSKRS